MEFQRQGLMLAECQLGGRRAPLQRVAGCTGVSEESVCIFHDVIILRTPVGEITGVFALRSPRTAVRAEGRQ